MALTTRQLLNAIGLKGNGVQLLIGLGLNFTKMYFERQSSSSSDVVGGLTIGLPFQVFVVAGFGEHCTTWQAVNFEKKSVAFAAFHEEENEGSRGGCGTPFEKQMGYAKCSGETGGENSTNGVTAVSWTKEVEESDRGDGCRLAHHQRSVMLLLAIRSFFLHLIAASIWTS
jgi:hypothetical protein